MMQSIRLRYVGKVCSINKRFGRSKNGRLFLAPEYRTFLEYLIKTFKAQKKMNEESGNGVFPWVGRVSLEMVCYTGNRMDIDALIKPVLDSIQKACILKNDIQVKRLLVQKEDCTDIPEIKIKIDKLENTLF